MKATVRNVSGFLACALCILFLKSEELDAATYWSGLISSDTVWTAAASPHVITSGLTVAASATLTLEGGVVVKLSSSNLVVQGALVLQSSPGNQVIFTSLRDDAADGDDTNGDGPTLPAAGNWGAIVFKPGSTTSMHDATLRFGGGLAYTTSDSQTYATMLIFDNIAADVKHCSFSDVGNSHPLAFVNPPAPTLISNNLMTRGGHCVLFVSTKDSTQHTTIQNNTITQCSDGLYYEEKSTGRGSGVSILGNRVFGNTTGMTIRGPSSGSEIRCNVVESNQTGVWLFQADGVTMTGNSFFENTLYAAYNSTNDLVIAENNYWGAPDGPGPVGGGDLVYGSIDYVPYLSQPVDEGGAVCADNCPGVANPDQRDYDQDGIGDACDPLTDGGPRVLDHSRDAFLQDVNIFRNMPATYNESSVFYASETEGDEYRSVILVFNPVPGLASGTPVQVEVQLGNELPRRSNTKIISSLSGDSFIDPDGTVLIDSPRVPRFPGDYDLRVRVFSDPYSDGVEEWVVTDDFVLKNADGLNNKKIRVTGDPPIVLIHGWNGARDSWGELEKLLEEDAAVRRPVRNFEYPTSSVFNRKSTEAPAYDLGWFLRRANSGLRYAMVDIVGHSQGGLVARAYIAGLAEETDGSTLNYRGEVRRLVTIATPHYGAIFGGELDDQTKAMDYGSQFLWDLNQKWDGFSWSGRALTLVGTNDGIKTHGDNDIVVRCEAAHLLRHGSPIYFVPEMHFNGIARIVEREHKSYPPIQAFLNSGMPLSTPLEDDVLRNGILETGMLTLRVHKSNGLPVDGLAVANFEWDPVPTLVRQEVNDHESNIHNDISNIYWATGVGATASPNGSLYAVRVRATVDGVDRSRCTTVRITRGGSAVKSLDIQGPDPTDIDSLNGSASADVNTLALSWEDKCARVWKVKRSLSASSFTDAYEETLTVPEWTDPAPLNDGQTYFYLVEAM